MSLLPAPANHNGLGLKPGEPYFVVRGQDLFAIAIVATWIIGPGGLASTTRRSPTPTSAAAT